MMFLDLRSTGRLSFLYSLSLFILLAQSCSGGKQRRPPGSSDSQSALLRHEVSCKCFDGVDVVYELSYMTDEKDKRYNLVPLDQRISLRGGSNAVEAIVPMDAFSSGPDVHERGKNDLLLVGFKCIQESQNHLLSVYGISRSNPNKEFFGFVAESGNWTYQYYEDIDPRFQTLDSLKLIYGAEILSDLNNMINLLP